MESENIGKWLVAAGVLLAAAGGAVWLAGKAGIPLGRLPGDIHVEGERTSFHFPVVTFILISLVLTLVVNAVIRFFQK